MPISQNLRCLTLLSIYLSNKLRSGMEGQQMTGVLTFQRATGIICQH